MLRSFCFGSVGGSRRSLIAAPDISFSITSAQPIARIKMPQVPGIISTWHYRYLALSRPGPGGVSGPGNEWAWMASMPSARAKTDKYACCANPVSAG